MKILHIHFKNLNSLRGEWHIDLTDSRYTSDGIFAVTGSTGAGKTTIFDAVCLALYAQTPRLGKITGSSNEIMSKHTRECYAEVIVSSNGKTYKCSWSQHKDSKGRLQAAKHMISETESGQIIAGSSREVQDAVESITGMDFTRFMQAVMLRQGGFDSFLRAKASERSKVLESLTGTEIYGDISTAVYERTSIEQKKLDSLRIDLESRKPRDSYGTDEEIAHLLRDKQEEFTRLETEHADMKNAVDWLRNILALERELSQVDGDIARLRTEIEAFAPSRLRLDSAQRANDLMTAHTSLKAKRQQHQTTQDRCDDNQRRISGITAELKQIDSELSSLQDKLSRRTKNITGSPDSAHAKAVELLNIYIQAAKKIPDLESAKSQAEARVHKAERDLASAEEEYKLCLEHYEEAVIYKTRRELTPGTPCPVCGSTEHPAVIHSDNTGGSGISTIDFEKASKKLQAVQSERSSAGANLDHHRRNLDAGNDDKIAARAKVLEAIEPMEIFEAGIKSCGEITSRLDNWINEVRNLQDKITSYTQRGDKLKAEKQTRKAALTKDSSDLETFAAELVKMEDDFRAALAGKGFASEADFMNAQMTGQEFADLQAKARRLDEGMGNLSAVKSDRTSRLESEKAKGLTTSTLDELMPGYDKHEADINTLRKEIYALEHAINERRKYQEETQELRKDYEAQSVIYERWAALNKLIGSQNGNKFRVFAQKITLDMMIALANKQLERMSGRYCLIAAPGDDGLALSVIDKDQAGEIRPTANLSGGESFIVSLALALGLSQISGSKARVDSLFLDEGFGSLDEDSLNTALEALGEVRREGRMIGIISHVSALRERIAAQINVKPLHEGMSVIEGPGCSHKS